MVVTVYQASLLYYSIQGCRFSFSFAVQTLPRICSLNLARRCTYSIRFFFTFVIRHTCTIPSLPFYPPSTSSFRPTILGNSFPTLHPTDPLRLCALSDSITATACTPLSHGSANNTFSYSHHSSGSFVDAISPLTTPLLEAFSLWHFWVLGIPSSTFGNF